MTVHFCDAFVHDKMKNYHKPVEIVWYPVTRIPKSFFLMWSHSFFVPTQGMQGCIVTHLIFKHSLHKILIYKKKKMLSMYFSYPVTFSLFQLKTQIKVSLSPFSHPRKSGCQTTRKKTFSLLLQTVHGVNICRFL